MTDRQDDIFKALADRHRRRIVAALCQGPCVAGQLAQLVGLAPNAVSFHLKWLRAAGLVTVRRQGRYLHYHAGAETLATWLGQVNAFFPATKTQALPTIDHQTSPVQKPGARKQPTAIRKRPPRRSTPKPPSKKVVAPRWQDSFSDPLPTELL